MDRTELREYLIDRMSRKIIDGEYSTAHREKGIRSRQIYALLDLLIELGVIDEKKLTELDTKVFK